ncbi:(Na+)-NQR maturation NqrM [Gallibacterium melopsittaci]|uniref:(Na+)-NQR maturation NqrM n=1 Tax=Gallibacterium melopsittaci TaxID=516063 RepID=A0ABV6HX59_9PAST
MKLFLVTFGFFIVVIFAMAIGYLIKRKTISGSCGGISSLGLEKVCDCPEPCENRKAKMAKEAERQAKLQEAGRIL